MSSVEAEKPVGLVFKANAVLRALAKEPVQSTAQIAAAIGEPTSSVYRLLDAMVRIDWIEAAPGRGLYRLSPHWMAYAATVSRGVDLRRLALPVLQELRARTGETAFLCVRRGDRAACIERVDGEGVQSLALAIGGSLPLHLGAAPQVLLAAESLTQIDKYFSSLSDTDAAPLRQQIHEVAQRGYAVSDGDVTGGIAALGAPIRNHTSIVIAAVSLSGLREIVFDPDRRSLAHLLDAAARLSTALGFAKEKL